MIKIFSSLIGGTIIALLLFMHLLLANGIIGVAVESFESEYYQTTTWEESDSYWYVEASIGKEVAIEDFNWSIKLTDEVFYNRFSKIRKT